MVFVVENCHRISTISLQHIGTTCRVIYVYHVQIFNHINCVTRRESFTFVHNAFFAFVNATLFFRYHGDATWRSASEIHEICEGYLKRTTYNILNNLNN